ncbi:MAG TPA: acetolactate synthase large subunit [Candidatus Bathyarchaeia archaeon]|nr:acetolactate synthase large subunit [Candidatus Bathyarchaeia archaeon]
MKASDLFVKALENEGVEYIFGIPGEENLDLLESIRTSSIKLILTRHEQAAGFMAATYGRFTGKAGVCLSTLGPGATNLVTAAAYAQLGGMPLVMITGQKPIKTSKQGRFQIVDIVNMMKPLTYFTKQIVNGNAIPSIIREAFRLAEEERPGAVHIELPEDIAREETTTIIFEKHDIRRPSADDKAINSAIKVIELAKNPLLLIGAGANRKRIQNALEDFINKTGIPFFNTQMAKGAVDERHPLFLGTAALSDNDYLHCAIRKADIIINVGHDIIEKPPFFMRHGESKVIHINFFKAHIDDVYFPQIEVIGDIANSVLKITNNITVNKKWNFEYYLKVKKEVDRHTQQGSDCNDFPVKPQRLVADVRKAVPDDGIITLDNGIYKIWFSRNYYAYEPNSIILDNALASMGAGLPSGLAAKIVYPNKKVLAICGDGGFLMNSQELETAIRLNLDLTVLIVNDGGYGMIKWKQKIMKFEDWGLDFTNPDFVKYAESYGAKGYRLSKTEDLLPLLQNCLNSTGVHVIDLPIDYSENVKVLIDELFKLVCIIDPSIDPTKELEFKYHL